jgi:hypothetical protein
MSSRSRSRLPAMEIPSNWLQSGNLGKPATWKRIRGVPNADPNCKPPRARGDSGGAMHRHSRRHRKSSRESLAAAIEAMEPRRTGAAGLTLAQPLAAGSGEGEDGEAPRQPPVLSPALAEIAGRRPETLARFPPSHSEVGDADNRMPVDSWRCRTMWSDRRIASYPRRCPTPSMARSMPRRSADCANFVRSACDKTPIGRRTRLASMDTSFTSRTVEGFGRPIAAHSGRGTSNGSGGSCVLIRASGRSFESMASTAPGRKAVAEVSSAGLSVSAAPEPRRP